jgi:capsular polysaccharide transport system permease protein
LVVLTIAFYAMGWLELPEDLLQVIAGWLLLCWFAAGLGMTMGGLSEKAEVVGRFWHPVSYVLMIVSGVAYMVDALPPSLQRAVLWVPMINGVEFMREGWFGSQVRAHYDIAYMVGANIALTLIGISLVRQIGFDASEE